MQVIERIFKLKEDNDERVFKLSILKMKWYPSLWYGTLKKNWAKEGKS